MFQRIGIEETSSAEIIIQLKDKYHVANRSEQIQILTILPQSWSIREIQAEFGASKFAARQAKALVREKGILSPNPKLGHSLPDWRSYMKMMKTVG